MKASKLRQNWQQIEDGKFIGGNDQLAFLQFAQLRERFGGLAAQIDQFFSVFVEDFAGVGQDAFARGTVKKSLAKFLFEFPDGLADGGLGAKQLVGRPGKAVLARYEGASDPAVQ